MLKNLRLRLDEEEMLVVEGGTDRPDAAQRCVSLESFLDI